MQNIIEQERKKNGMTQNDLAIACEVTRQTINAIENNKYDPTLKLAFSIAKVLSVSVDELFKSEF